VLDDPRRRLTVRGRGPRGEWQRGWALPPDVNGAGIDLDVANGTLTVLIPKK
jgi:HSP20 family molecular chaperone IbpA